MACTLYRVKAITKLHLASLTRVQIAAKQRLSQHNDSKSSSAYMHCLKSGLRTSAQVVEYNQDCSTVCKLVSVRLYEGSSTDRYRCECNSNLQ